MKTGKTILLAATGALFLGTLLSTMMSSAEGKPDTSPLTVPVGHVGDDVVYAYDGPFKEYQEWESEGPSPGGDPSQATQESDAGDIVDVHRLRVDHVGHTLDRTGQLRDVVIVSTNDTYHGATTWHHVDLGHRIVVRSDYRLEAPGTRFASSTFDLMLPPMPGLSLQGHTFTLGQDLPLVRTGPLGVIPWLGWTDFAQGDEVEEGLEYTLRGWVAERALVGGHDAYALRLELQARQTCPPPARPECVVMEGSLQSNVWVAADVPYPLLMEDLFEVRGVDGMTLSGRIARWLVQYTEGKGPPIAWADQATPFRDHNVDVQRTTGIQWHPADGTGAALEYPLSQALADVDNDPSLVALRVWRLNHPAARLVGASMEPGVQSTQQAPTLAWSLTFGQSDGTAHAVITERVRGSPAALTRDQGDVVTRRFDAALMPPNPVTVAGALDLWGKMVTPELQSQAVNLVAWGLQRDVEWGSCLPHGEQWSIDSIYPFATMQVGFTSDITCLQDDPLVTGAMLTLASRTGNVTSYVESRTGPDLSASRATTGDRPAVQAKLVSGGLKAPQVEHAAAASTGLFAAFLAVYFLPALKFVSAKALLLVPGYSKLSKDELLDNRLRDQLAEQIRENPGIHASELGRRVDAGWGTIVYHLGVLEKNKLVSSLVDGRHKRFFPVGTVDWSARGQLAVLHNERTKALYELIHGEPGIATTLLATRTGLTLPAASWHLQRLEESGLVGRVKKGRSVHFFPNEGKPMAPYDPADAKEVA